MINGKQLKGHLKLKDFLSVTLLLINQPLTIVGKEKQVCYELFGCFSTTKFIPFTPDPPEKIGAHFRVFNANDDRSSPDRIISYHDTKNYDVFNSSTSVLIMVHGWLDNGQEPWYRTMFPPLLTKYDLVISVDWSKGAAGLLYPKNVANVQLIGREIGYLLYRLNTEVNLDLKKVHIVGFSLGAHVAGLAGRWAKQKYNLTVGRVTGKLVNCFIISSFIC